MLYKRALSVQERHNVPPINEYTNYLCPVLKACLGEKDPALNILLFAGQVSRGIRGSSVFDAWTNHTERATSLQLYHACWLAQLKQYDQEGLCLLAYRPQVSNQRTTHFQSCRNGFWTTKLRAAIRNPEYAISKRKVFWHAKNQRDDITRPSVNDTRVSA